MVKTKHLFTKRIAFMMAASPTLSYQIPIWAPKARLHTRPVDQNGSPANGALISSSTLRTQSKTADPAHDAHTNAKRGSERATACSSQQREGGKAEEERN